MSDTPISQAHQALLEQRRKLADEMIAVAQKIEGLDMAIAIVANKRAAALGMI